MAESTALETRYCEYDVVVAGGGLAGVAAAVAAARNVAHTLLVEKNGFLDELGVVGAAGWRSFLDISTCRRWRPIWRPRG